MRIVEVQKKTIHFVETDDEHINLYIRYDYNNWSVRLGESEEPVYDEKLLIKLETLFKDWMSNKQNENS